MSQENTNHTYVVVQAPINCKAYKIDDLVRLWVPEPPPQTLVMNFSGNCVNIELQLVS